MTSSDVPFLQLYMYVKSCVLLNSLEVQLSLLGLILAIPMLRLCGGFAGARVGRLLVFVKIVLFIWLVSAFFVVVMWNILPQMLLLSAKVMISYPIVRVIRYVCSYAFNMLFSLAFVRRIMFAVLLALAPQLILYFVSVVLALMIVTLL